MSRLLPILCCESLTCKCRWHRSIPRKNASHSEIRPRIRACWCSRLDLASPIGSASTSFRNTKTILRRLAYTEIIGGMHCEVIKSAVEQILGGRGASLLVGEDRRFLVVLILDHDRLTTAARGCTSRRVSEPQVGRRHFGSETLSLFSIVCALTPCALGHVREPRDGSQIVSSTGQALLCHVGGYT